MKRLNQELGRKELSVSKLKQKIKVMRADFSQSATGKVISNLRRNLNRTKQQCKTLKSDNLNTVKVDSEVSKLKEQIKNKNELISELENENLVLKDAPHTPPNSQFKKEGKSYPVHVRMCVYDAIVNNVPTNNVTNLLTSFSRRCGLDIGQVPHRTTVELMARELGIISDFQAAELLLKNEDVTLGFDATTQEGVHINSVHITTKEISHVLAIDQLPGGTAEDYELHINETIDSLTDVYCRYYCLDFEEIRTKILRKISNTMTDRAKVNHATIQRLELSWRKSLNELNCHLHPLDTISSSIRTTLKECEPSPVSKKLFGSESVAHQLILAINKFRFKDGKGDPKGFVSALQSAGLPKGLLPRYRGNRLHIMFNLAGKFHAHRDFFLQLFSEGTITCGGLQSAILQDFQSSVAQTEFHILGLIGKLLSGPWMLKFYTAGSSQEVSHLDGTSIVKNLIPVLKHFSDNPQDTITSEKDFFGR